jgi:hypothetical protein
VVGPRCAWGAEGVVVSATVSATVSTMVGNTPTLWRGSRYACSWSLVRGRRDRPALGWGRSTGAQPVGWGYPKGLLATREFA